MLSKGRNGSSCDSVAAKRMSSAVGLSCYRCGQQGQISRNCRRPPQEKTSFNNGNPSGNGRRLTVKSRPPVAPTQSAVLVAIIMNTLVRS
jgi:hypothetical protein